MPRIDNSISFVFTCRGVLGDDVLLVIRDFHYFPFLLFSNEAFNVAAACHDGRKSSNL